MGERAERRRWRIKRRRESEQTQRTATRRKRAGRQCLRGAKVSSMNPAEKCPRMLESVFTSTPFGKAIILNEIPPARGIFHEVTKGGNSPARRCRRSWKRMRGNPARSSTRCSIWRTLSGEIGPFVSGEKKTYSLYQERLNDPARRLALSVTNISSFPLDKISQIDS